MTLFKNFLFFSVVFSMVACGKEQPANWLMNPKPQNEVVDQAGPTPEFDVTPKAEILFVVDNSESMEKHILNVSQSIDSFVRSFSENNPLEYNLAVMTVYDSRTYESRAYREQYADKMPPAQMGEFLPVKKSSSESVPNKYFISSRDENLRELLRSTLKVGVRALNDGGPQYEEAFSPIAAAYGFGSFFLNESIRKRQSGFFMGPDSYKIIFFITDATDASFISASELYGHLVRSANGDHAKVLSFAAIVPSDYVDPQIKTSEDKTKCRRDPGNKAYKMEEFLDLTRVGERGSNVVSLCTRGGGYQSFGKRFAEFGKSLREQTLPSVIPLRRGLPVINGNPEETLRVFYGAQEIPYANKPGVIGFKYNPNTNSIRIDPQFPYQYQPGARLQVKYITIAPSDIRHGRVEAYKGDAQ